MTALQRGAPLLTSPRTCPITLSFRWLNQAQAVLIREQRRSTLTRSSSALTTARPLRRFSLTTFSPSGKLVQIEHALAAVASGTTSLGIKGALPWPRSARRKGLGGRASGTGA